MKKLFFIALYVLSWTNFATIFSTQKKIVGLMAVRNEAPIVAQSLRALACYTDAIVLLDDASTDNTIAITESLKEDCHIEIIIKKDTWYRDEPGDRNKLLQAGRSIGGTHFICIDADEMLTANCMDHDCLREYILTLRPGESLALFWIQLWRSTDFYRADRSVWGYRPKEIIFCDDTVCSYSSEFIHTNPIPKLTGARKFLNSYLYGLLHFQFVNWENLLIKQAWYRCLEHIRQPEKKESEINERYSPSKDESDVILKRVPDYWFKGYSFYDTSVWSTPESWRKEDVLSWFASYGKDYFKKLDIWDINWFNKSSVSKIVGLVQVHNEENMVEQCLRALACYTDAIVVLDDGSQDQTLSIVRSLAEELRIEVIIDQRESAWQKTSEYCNRTLLLTTGRKIGGTHFILIDADELFTANCAQDNWLRNKILSLRPGQAIVFPMVNVWDGICFYRDDSECSPSQKKWKIEAIFCDDGFCNYDDNPIWAFGKTLHISRFPFNLSYRNERYLLLYEPDLNHSIIHFKCSNLENLKIKHVWYMCLEYMRALEGNIDKSLIAKNINRLYSQSNLEYKKNSSNIRLTPINSGWFNYSFFKEESFLKDHDWRKREILGWIDKCPQNFFSFLDITQEEWDLIKN